MNLLIGGILALFCVQSIHALFANQCQRDLSNYKRQTKKFFWEFDREHDIAHDDYLAIKKLCNDLTAALALFADPNYGSGKNAAKIECEVAEFNKSFFGVRISAVEHITHLWYEIVILLDQVDDFRCKNNVVCVAGESNTGCDAEFNKFKCDLAAFFQGVIDAGVQAKQILRGLLDGCDILGEKTRSFDCSINPTCHGTGCSCGGNGKGNPGNPNILLALKSFISDFIPAHDVAHELLENLGVLCGALTEGINYWKSIL
ncbi:hypothetical protein Bhyg_01922 [Pseudolycoriella hygida]|uniref:Uncharacterized protein n=1 Tax=Pseudolycoriella hygida TaxID=35572 RepID=A0A9Q0NAL9_9DIPT|nr:hypothetical protein Bhyg_01922 [Pseudolycoriella hygida]